MSNLRKSLIQEQMKKFILTDTYTLNSTALDDFIQNWCVFKKMPKNMNQYFRGLLITKCPLMDTSQVTSMELTFNNCYIITEINNLDYNNVTSLYSTFEYCNALRKVNINSSNCINFRYCFDGCNSLKNCTIDFKNANLIEYCFRFCSQLNNLLIYNLGTIKTCQPLLLNNTIWGQGSNEARKSLFDSLLTYSFDRKSAGYADLTVTLPAASLAVLTDDEKTAIAAKGFNLVSA
jgi:hypothetical protein